MAMVVPIELMEAGGGLVEQYVPIGDSVANVPPLYTVTQSAAQPNE